MYDNNEIIGQLIKFWSKLYRGKHNNNICNNCNQYQFKQLLFNKKNMKI